MLGNVAAKLRGIVTLRDTAQADVEQSVQLLDYARRHVGWPGY